MIGFVKKSLALGILTGKKTPWNRIPALLKSMNMDVWVVDTSNQLFTQGS